MKSQNEVKKLIFFFTVIPVALVLVFSYIPIFAVFFYSLTDWGGDKLNDFTFVGLANYKMILTNPNYIALFKNTIWYMLSSIPQLIFALILAIILNDKIRGEKGFKAIVMIPYLLNGVVVALLFSSFLNQSGGLNQILGIFGIDSQMDWLTNSKVVNPILASISVWRYYGFNFILFLAAIQSIPENLYEACDIDGAGYWYRIRYLIIPSIRRILFINILLSVSGAIQVFEMPYIMTSGNFGSSTPLIAINQIAFQDMRVGMGAAFSVIILIIVATVVVIQNLLFKEED
ncbi:sugar ABC transporter permease [Mollicutes bacterium LVI A0078]|nr:sugar ABC transporter permease [Mollicutes bacterium LVI A0075]WOO90375.1 sugar ABC transporter permease [Mollicutes bacterium LVI A0078]